VKNLWIAVVIAATGLVSCSADDDPEDADADAQSGFTDLSPAQHEDGDNRESVRMSDATDPDDDAKTPVDSDFEGLVSGDLIVPTGELLPASTPLSLINGALRGFETSRESVFAIDSRAGDCMRAKGFEYWPQVSQHAYFVSDYATIGQRLEHAERVGYGIYYSVTEEGVRETEERNELILAEDLPNVDLDDAYRLAYIGLPNTSLEAVMTSPAMQLDELGDGCLREAIVSYRTDHGLPDLAEELLSELYALPYWTSSEIQTSVDRWIECMAEAGIEADAMNTLERDILSDFDNEIGRDSPEEVQQRFEEERRIAVAHVLCDWEHALPARLQLEYDYILELAESFPPLAPFLAGVAGHFG